MMNLTIGKVYMIRGGHLLRYRGPYSASCLAFGPISEEVSDAVGASIAQADVLYEITPEQLDMVRFRRAECAARDLDSDVAEMDFLLAEISV